MHQGNVPGAQRCQVRGGPPEMWSGVLDTCMVVFGTQDGLVHF